MTDKPDKSNEPKHLPEKPHEPEIPIPDTKRPIPPFKTRAWDSADELKKLKKAIDEE